MLDQADAGKLHLLTSTATLTEVLLIHGRPPVPADKRERVRWLFRNSYVQAIPLSRKEAELAQDLVWDRGVKPKDALQFASAISAKADRFNTYDKDLPKRQEIALPEHRLVVEKPQVSQMSSIYG